MQKILRGAVVSACFLAASQAAFADVTVTGDYIKFGVGNNGSLIDFSSNTGLQYDPTGSGKFTSAYDALTPGTPFAFYSLGVNGASATAGGYNTSYNPFASVTGNFSAGDNVFTITSGGSYNGLAINQVISFDKKSNVIHTNVVLTNTTKGTLNNVAYAVGFDPDQDSAKYLTPYTHNTILGQGTDAAVMAAGTDYAITLRNTSGWDANATVRADWATDAYQLATDAYNSGYSDSTVALGYNLGSLGAGKQFSIGYDYVVTSVSAVPEPTTWAMMLGGLALLGAARRRRA